MVFINLHEDNQKKIIKRRQSKKWYSLKHPFYNRKGVVPKIKMEASKAVMRLIGESI